MSAQLVPVSMKTEPEPLMLGLGHTSSARWASGTSTTMPGPTALVGAEPRSSNVSGPIRSLGAALSLGKVLSLKAVLIGARIGGAAAGFLVQLLLARLLTPDGLGLFFSVTSLAAITALLAARGYPSIAARFITRYEQRNQGARLSAFIGQASREALNASLFAAALITLGAVVYPDLEPGTRYALVAAALSVPAMTALALYGAFAGAVRHFVVGLFPELLLRPIIFLLVIAGCMIASTALTASAAVLMLTFITIGLAGMQFRLVSRRLPGAIASGETRLSAHWRREGMPLIVVMLFTSFFADLGVLVETLFLAPAELAAFGICLKVSLIVGFVVQIAHQILLPDIAEAYARRDLAEVPGRLLKAAWMPIAFTASSTLAAILWGDQFLALFGQEFTHAKWVLVLLVCCQLLRALAGPSAHLLTLVGAQQANAAICGGSFLVLLVASALLAPSLGITGAAAAVCITFGFWLTAAAIELRRTGGIRSDFIGLTMA